MRADSDAMIDREADSLADGGRVTAVEAARDVRRSDVRHDFGISAHLPGAVAFTHVAIEIDAFHSVIQATQACAMGEQFSPGDAEEDGAGPGEPAVELAAEQNAVGAREHLGSRFRTARVRGIDDLAHRRAFTHLCALGQVIHHDASPWSVADVHAAHRRRLRLDARERARATADDSLSYQILK